MQDGLKLLGVLAHPDDESMGMGGILAKYSAEGVETHLVTATRGEHGWFGAPEDNPGPEKLGRIREAELCAAAKVLGVRDVAFLDYVDGHLDEADPQEVIAKIAQHIRRVRPQVVFTFDQNGAYGHPDHIAISQLTTAAVVAAADSTYSHEDIPMQPAHRVAKLYYLAETRQLMELYQAAFGELAMDIDGVKRSVVAWEQWAITTRIDTTAYWQQVWAAIECHQSQLPGYEVLKQLPEADHHILWGDQNYYRAFSLVNGGRRVERDLFEGLRR
jgi:LmbE family N-acetylglucosaminyl deacetylase